MWLASCAYCAAICTCKSVIVEQWSSLSRVCTQYTFLPIVLLSLPENAASSMLVCLSANFLCHHSTVRGLTTTLTPYTNTGCGVFQFSKCDWASKTLLYIIARLWMVPHSSFLRVHLCYMQYTSSLGYWFFILTRYLPQHTTTSIVPLLPGHERKIHAEIVDGSSYFLKFIIVI